MRTFLSPPFRSLNWHHVVDNGILERPSVKRSLNSLYSKSFSNIQPGSKKYVGFPFLGIKVPINFHQQVGCRLSSFVEATLLWVCEPRFQACGGNCQLRLWILKAADESIFARHIVYGTSIHCPRYCLQYEFVFVYKGRFQNYTFEPAGDAF